MNMPHLVKLSFSYNRLVSMRVIRKITCPLLNQIQLDNNYHQQEDGLAEGQYLPNISFWLYCSEHSIQKQRLSKRISAKLHPIALRM